MELHTPAPLSDDDIYQFAESGQPSSRSSGSLVNGEDAERSVTAQPINPGRTAQTMISDPVVVCLTDASGAAPSAPTVPRTGQNSDFPPAISDTSTEPILREGLAPELGSASARAGLPTKGAVALTARKLRTRPRGPVQVRYLMQAWSVSLLVHVGILSALAALTFSPETVKKIINFDSALASFAYGEQEMLPIYADPDTIARDRAIGNEHADAAGETTSMEAADDGSGSEGDDGGGVISASGLGSGRPSKTPRVRGVGKGKINEGSSLPGVKVDGLGGSPLALIPPTPGADLSGGGKIAGDPIFDVKEIGAALDQLAREILRHLKDHKLTVVWLFDESTSMEDDKRTIYEKFDRVSSELKLNVEPNKKAASALNHAIIGFGQGIDYVLEKPRDDIDQIGRAIKRLKIDQSGTENTMHALREVVEHYANLIRKDRNLLIVLVTDESGDDGTDIEEARQALKKHKVPLYVIGRQSLFGYPFAHHRYVDPVTKDVYFPVIRRGPETADVENYQWDGLHERWDEQPSGFAPYELARLTKDSGGIYFVLPSEEFMRVRQREQAYSSTQLKEYLPEYDNRMTYVERRNSSPLRQMLYAIILEGKNFLYRRYFPIETEELVKAAMEEGEKATVKLNVLLEVQKRLEGLAKIRDREPEKRWQAHYDLMLAQTVAFEVKAYEYRALMASIIKSTPLPKRQAAPDTMITWRVDHATAPWAAQSETTKKYAEAERHLKQVIARHPKTPWADLAQDTLDRGFSVQLTEWHHNPKYFERAQYVPKY
jgi:hypothetical protein